MRTKPKGTLIIIGGHEDKEGDREILTEVARRADGKNGRLVVVTAATSMPEEVADEYHAVFTDLGVKQIEILDIRTREEALAEGNVQKLANASVVFFTGGDQLRITSQIGDSLVYRCMKEIYERGGTIVGTSAGAAAMPETMLIGGESDKSYTISALSMAPGLGLLPDVVVDSHFAERGRMGRLLGAVVQNPRNLGLGIDEDTAIVTNGTEFQVVGSGAVYIVDGSGITYSSLSDDNANGVVSMENVRLHVAGRGDCFDLLTRRPLRNAIELGR